MKEKRRTVLFNQIPLGIMNLKTLRSFILEYLRESLNKMLRKIVSFSAINLLRRITIS